MQKSKREVGLAEAALRALYAEEVYGLTTVWSWRVSAMHDVLRLLREEHELQADVMRKMDERVALFENEREREIIEREKREREEREREERERRERDRRERERREREDREKRRARIFRPGSNCAVPAKRNISRSW